MKNKLEIIIPTYNRVKNLTNTINQLLNENSPVKECLITILDNSSTDDTQHYCTELAKKYCNIKYIKHKINIGMGANITKAMEIASKPYYWLIGDDDSYDFSNWSEVENAMSDNADCIVVADFTLVDKSVGSCVSQLGLLSAGIYKTSNITSDVLQNAYANIINMFPHMALICDLVNENKKFVITKPITIWGTTNPDPEGKAYIRGAKTESKICPRLKYMYLIPAWFNCLEMLKDSNLKYDLINNTYKYSKLSKNLTNSQFIKNLITDNKNLFNNYFLNLVDLFYGFNFNNKIILLFYYILIFFKAWFYEKKKDADYKYITILGLKIKIKRRNNVHN